MGSDPLTPPRIPFRKLGPELDVERPFPHRTSVPPRSGYPGGGIREFGFLLPSRFFLSVFPLVLGDGDSLRERAVSVREGQLSLFLLTPECKAGRVFPPLVSRGSSSISPAMFPLFYRSFLLGRETPLPSRFSFMSPRDGGPGSGVMLLGERNVSLFPPTPFFPHVQG